MECDKKCDSIWCKNVMARIRVNNNSTDIQWGITGSLIVWQQSIAANMPTLWYIIRHIKIRILVYLYIKNCIELISWELTTWEVDLVGVDIVRVDFVVTPYFMPNTLQYRVPYCMMYNALCKTIKGDNRCWQRLGLFDVMSRKKSVRYVQLYLMSICWNVTFWAPEGGQDFEPRSWNPGSSPDKLLGFLGEAWIRG